jgi:His/Glu/Gln/Arg/opine family amino acid ABC transporter permease subunit
METGMINFDLIKESLPQLLHGALITLTIAFCSAILGFIGGTLLAICQTFKSRLLQIIIYIYIHVIRGTPMLIQIVFLYILLPHFGIYISKFSIAVLAIGINSAAYVSQIVRSGIKSVSYGQIEAAQTLGISNIDLMRFIVLPQALRVIIPALGNELITLVKDSSLASIIGVTELYMEGTIIKNKTYDALTVYTAVAICYLLITSVLSLIMYKIEKNLNYARN